MLRILPLLGILLAGCITSIDIKPPTPPVPQDHRALNLSITLGEVQLIDQGMEHPLSDYQRRRTATDFEVGFNELRLVREIRPPGQPADLVYTVTSREFSDFGRDRGIAVYQALLGLPALFLPIPYPYQMEYHDIVQLRTRLDGSAYLVREYDIHSSVTIWGLTVWAPLFAEDNIQLAIVKRVIPQTGHKMLADYSLYERLEQAIRSRDEAAIRKLLIQPRHPAPSSSRPQ